MLQAILREHFSAWFLRYAVSQSGHTATPPPIVAGKWGRTLWFDISCCNEIKMRTYGQNESTSNPDLMFECWCCLVASGLFIFCGFFFVKCSLFALGLCVPTTRYCVWKRPLPAQSAYCLVASVHRDLPFALQFRAVDGAMDRVGSSTCSALSQMGLAGPC